MASIRLDEDTMYKVVDAEGFTLHIGYFLECIKFRKKSGAADLKIRFYGQYS